MLLTALLLFFAPVVGASSVVSPVSAPACEALFSVGARAAKPWFDKIGFATTEPFPFDQAVHLKMPGAREWDTLKAYRQLTFEALRKILVDKNFSDLQIHLILDRRDQILVAAAAAERPG